MEENQTPRYTEYAYQVIKRESRLTSFNNTPPDWDSVYMKNLMI